LFAIGPRPRVRAVGRDRPLPRVRDVYATTPPGARGTPARAAAPPRRTELKPNKRLARRLANRKYPTPGAHDIRVPQPSRANPDASTHTSPLTRPSC